MSENHKRQRIILAAAERLLEHYGVYKTTVADIAREASIGVGSVYLEFGSKDDIIRRVAGLKHGGILDELESTARADAPAADRLGELLDTRARAFRRFMTSDGHKRDLIHCQCGPVLAAWRAYRASERALVASLIEAGVSSGEFSVTDAQETADVVIAAYASFEPPREPLEDSVFDERLRALTLLVLKGLRA